MDVVRSFISLSVFVSGTGPTECALLSSSCTRKKSHIHLVKNLPVEMSLTKSGLILGEPSKMGTKEAIYIHSRKIDWIV